jgi:hypothetical protein
MRLSQGRLEMEGVHSHRDTNYRTCLGPRSSDGASENTEREDLVPMVAGRSGNSPNA